MMALQFRKDALHRLQSDFIGPVNVMGVPCEHLAFSQNDIDWQLWLEKGPRPVPRKFVITYKDEPDSPEFTAIFSNWDFITQLPDFVFQFEPPQGSSKIDVREIRQESRSHQTQRQTNENENFLLQLHEIRIARPYRLPGVAAGFAPNRCRTWRAS